MRLETERLILRDYEEKDLADMIEGINDLEVSKWLALVPFPYTEEDGKSWLAYCLEHIKEGEDRSFYEFAIELKAEHKVIGTVGLDKINKLNGTAGGGIWLNAKYQGKGYGTEAFGKKIEFAFEDLGLRRLESGFIHGNLRSQKLHERFGYKLEGLKREAYICRADGLIKDEHILGLLKSEWIR